MEGHIDRLRAGVLDGWAWNSAQPHRPVCIEVWTAEGELLAIGVADQYREDLFNAAKGTGAHGFSIRLPIGTLKTKFIRARIVGGNIDLIGSPIILDYSLYDPSKNNDTTFDAHAWLAELYKIDESYASQLIEINDNLAKRRNSIQDELLKLNKEQPGIVNTLPAAGSAHPRSGKRDILIFPPIDWDYRYQRPQQIATELASLGHRVFYIAPTFLANDSKFTGCIYDTPSSGVFLVKLVCGYPHPEINRRSLNSNQIRDLSLSINRTISELSISAPVAFFQSPVWSSLHIDCKDVHYIYDCIDLISGFEATSQSMINAEKNLISKADLIFASSPQLIEYVRLHEPKEDPILIRNATSEIFFHVPLNFENTNNPTIGYLGAIEKWFDVDLLKKIAEYQPNWKIVLAGHPLPEIENALQNIPNIHFLGEIPAAQAPEILKIFDVAIIPFLNDGMTRFVNPVKVYEYLAAGRGVVSCKMPELDQFDEFVMQAEDAFEFCEKIKKILVTNNTSIAKARRMRVINETWVTRAVQISNTITLTLPAIQN